MEFLVFFSTSLKGNIMLFLGRIGSLVFTALTIWTWIHVPTAHSYVTATVTIGSVLVMLLLAGWPLAYRFTGTWLLKPAGLLVLLLGMVSVIHVLREGLTSVMALQQLTACAIGLWYCFFGVLRTSRRMSVRPQPAENNVLRLDDDLALREAVVSHRTFVHPSGQQPINPRLVKELPPLNAAMAAGAQISDQEKHWRDNKTLGTMFDDKL